MEEETIPILKMEEYRYVDLPVVSEQEDVVLIAEKPSCDFICSFSKQGSCASETKERAKSAKKLVGLITFYLIVMLVEVFGGIQANSLAVMTDAAHLLMDVAGFSIALFAVRASAWEATVDHSFGFSRLEVLGALVSVQLIWLISGILIYEAMDRLLHQAAKVNGGLMFGVAAFGFLINLIMVIFLGHDHDHHSCGHSHNHNHDHNHNHSHEHEENGGSTGILNINLQGAYLHVMTDLIQSIGVMIAGAIMWKKPEWYVVDLICTFIFSALALSTTIPMLRKIVGILMQRSPTEINVVGLESDLLCIRGVQSVHDLHIWCVTPGRIVLSGHIAAAPGIRSSEILHNVRDYCQKKHRIQHVTIQIEQ